MASTSKLSTRLRNLIIGTAAASALTLSVAAPPANALPAPAVGTSQAATAAPQFGSTRTLAAMPNASFSQRRLTKKTKRVLRAVRAKFPRIKRIGGYRPTSSGEHGKGRALDVMIPKWKSSSGKALGKKIARWARSNAGRLKIWYVIYNRKIWNIQRKRDGWRTMRDAGNANGNHRNHVHISVRR